ncbi:MAG: YqgE/AlgH family protein [Ginsengibacter sp.]
MNSPTKGTILIANPFLKDPNFTRSVIFLCENMQEGTFGFVLNQIYPKKLHELLPDLTSEKPLYKGGPVQVDTLHFLHQYPDLIIGGIEVIDGVYWGGNFESLQIHLKNESLNDDKIKFFVGYSGWTEGQLDFEMKEESWIVANATKELLFNTPPESIWKESLRHLGGKYELMVNFPLDPQLN